jgi:hypothetical protein
MRDTTRFRVTPNRVNRSCIVRPSASGVGGVVRVSPPAGPVITHRWPSGPTEVISIVERVGFT